MGDGPRMMPGRADVCRSGRSELIISRRNDAWPLLLASLLAVRVEKECGALGRAFCKFARRSDPSDDGTDVGGSEDHGNDDSEEERARWRATTWRVRAAMVRKICGRRAEL